MQDRDYQCVEDKGQIPTPETWVLVQALLSISFMDLGNLLFFSGLNFPHWYNVGVRPRPPVLMLCSSDLLSVLGQDPSPF